MSEPAIQSINQHTQKTSLDWLFNILVQPSMGTGSGVDPATHEQFGMSLDLLRQALVEVTNVVNVLTTTVPGKVLDARQGKVLADTIQAEIAKYAQPNGIATLGSDGKVPASQIPSLALVDVYPVASQAAMLALEAEQGDMAIRSDTSQVFILSTSPASTLENWIELAALKALVDAAIAEVKGEGYTEGSLKTHEDRLDTLEGTGEGSVAKAIDDAVSPLAEVVDTNRLYSDSQYLELKAKSDSLQIKCNTLQAEVYTDDPILQYGATEIIGKGYEADNTPIDVSANVVDGKLDIEQKGLTINNLVKNGDFSAGTTGWSAIGCTLSEISKVLTSTGNGLSNLPTVSRTLGNLPKSSVLYYRLRARVANSACTSIRINVQTFLSGSFVATVFEKAISNPVVGTDYTIELLGSLPPSGYDNTRIVALHTYANAATANGKVLEIYGNYGVSVYNLTALGLASITDTDILAKLLPYVDGTKNVGKIGMRVVGKNLFDRGNYIMGGFISDTGLYSSIYTSSYCNRRFLPFNALFGLRLQINIASVLGGVQVYFYSDATESSYLGRSFFSESTTFKNLLIPTGAKYFRIMWLKEYNEKEIMLTYGSTALPYEPYQEQLTFLPAIGNSLPNGVADSIKTVADGWEHTKRVSTPVSVASGVAVNTTNYPTSKNTGQWVNELTAGGTEIGVVGTDSTTGAGMLRFELATPIVTKYDLPHLTSGKTIHRFAGEEKIALYGTGVTFTENVLSVLSAVKFVAGVMTDITSLATITTNTVTFSGVNATDVVYVKVEHSVNRPLGILEHTPAVSNTASRLAAIEAWIAAQGA